MKKPRWLNIFYKILMLFAAPSALWVAFEMYGLTLFGSQMLFYSISHAFPGILGVVMFSVIFYLLLLVVNIVFGTFYSLSVKLNPPRNIILFIMSFQLFHVAALITYEFWAHIAVLRIITALFGLAFVFFTVAAAGKYVFAPNKALKTDAESAV